jgi:hypothetical protein
LHLERQPLATLEHIRRIPWVYPGDRRITPGHFVPGVAGQYQRAPSPQDDGMLMAWFRSYAANERPETGWMLGGLPQKLRPLNPTHFRPSALAGWTALCTTLLRQGHAGRGVHAATGAAGIAGPAIADEAVRLVIDQIEAG